MIRRAVREDSAAVVEIVVAAGMFATEDAWLVEGMMAEYFDGGQDAGHACLINDEDGPRSGWRTMDPSPPPTGSGTLR